MRKNGGKVRVFVHLAYGFDDEQWTRRWHDGTLVGINEPKPYGYHRAAADGCEVSYSHDHPEAKLARLARLGLRALLGFDLVHALRNRIGIMGADAVWTHTESQNLSVLAVLRFETWRRAQPRPVVIAQCVWLFDRLARFEPRARLWQALLRDADVITVHSSENLAIARRMFPDQRVELVRYGICTDGMLPARVRRNAQPLRIIAVGNDRHRDWPTLMAAVREQPWCELRIVSQTAPRSLAQAASNVEVSRVAHNDALKAAYEWADVAVVALKPNLHASGLTAIQEATVRGLPVVASDAGGLRAYFSDEELLFARGGDPEALRACLQACMNAPEQARLRTQRAQHKLENGGINSVTFVRRHVELSRELLATRGAMTAALSLARST
jgi:glycosyltransferase involved in cell wall biosynthesis